MEIEKYLNPTYKVIEEHKTADDCFVKVQSRELNFLIETLMMKVEEHSSMGCVDEDQYKAINCFINNYIKDDEWGLYYGYESDIQNRLNKKAENVWWLLDKFDLVLADVTYQLVLGGFNWFSFVVNGDQTRADYESNLKVAFEQPIKKMTVPLKYIFVKH